MRPRLSYRWSGASFRNIHNVFHTFKLIIAPAKPGKLKSRSNRVREVMQINRSPFSKVARVPMRFDHVAGIIVNANHRITVFRFGSLNRMMRSTLPLASKIRISPERKLARFSAWLTACSFSKNTGSTIELALSATVLAWR
jgi:hypothetical protein